jgi:hypothetical protein
VARVAIDEPDTDLRHLFTRVVERLGHEPVPASEALAAHVLLLDPDGRPPRREPVPSAVPVIVCSIYSSPDRFVDLRPVAHLVKPFTRRDLEEALERALGTLPVSRTA